tara:strand:+ start:345 stop:635 length:291 start_codon:yes stop_codon:yes gene_type:complete
MRATIEYFETGTKTIKYADGQLFFGDAMLSDYIGVKRTSDYLLIPSATVITIQTKELDEELFMADTDSIKRSKLAAIKRMDNDLRMIDNDGRPFHG